MGILDEKLAAFDMAQGRGFLPTKDPILSLPNELSYLDQFGKEIPDLLEAGNIIRTVESLPIPQMDVFSALSQSEKARARMIYEFGASAVIHSTNPSQVRLPSQLAVPLCHLSEEFGKPPILSYCSYALNNWRRIDPSKGIVLGNIELIQNFVKVYDENWFILVHIDIEAAAADAIEFSVYASHLANIKNTHMLAHMLSGISSSIDRMTTTLRRMPERCSPEAYVASVRPWIMSFKDVAYEGISSEPRSYRGETGAQSSIIPFLVAAFGGKHRRSVLTDHIKALHAYMPPLHKNLIDEMENSSKIRDFIIEYGGSSLKDSYNECLRKIFNFRDIHLEYASLYINQRTKNPEGTGGTQFMDWLKQMRDETEEWYLK